jgi:hypothetical protein
MPHYHFNFVGEKSVDAFFSGVFDSDASARDYASQLAASLQDSMPDDCKGSYICLLRDGEEIAQFLLSTTH